MGKFWQTPEFNALQREWNARLGESGFVDAEKGESERFLKDSASEMFREKTRRHERTQILIDSRFQYFQAISRFCLNEKEFDDDCDRFIMESTADGRTIREISEDLRKMVPEGKRRTKHNRYTIMFVRRRYEHRWGIRTWTSEQMRKKVRTK